MKKTIIILICTIFTTYCFGQNSNNDLKMISDYSSDNPEISDILQFEGIEYYKIKFIGKDLRDKSYQLTVKEFWDGKMVSDSTIINSKELPFEQFQKINDTILNLKIISKLTNNNKLKMNFKIGRLGFKREFDAIESDKYLLRNIAEESKIELRYNEKFYLLAYILPTKKENGGSSYCDIEKSGKDIENWGEKFGIKHYLTFQMKFE